MLSKENILALKTRREIYHFIRENPGLHVREISRRLNIPKSTLIHHIRYLKKQGIINERTECGAKQIFVSKDIGTQEKQILNLLRKEIPCRIFLYLIFSLVCSQVELSKELEIHPTTVTYHLKKMIDMDIIEEAPVRDGYIYPFTGPKNKHRKLRRRPVGRELFYRRKSQEIINLTYKILIKNRHSLTDESYINDYISYLDEAESYKKVKKHRRIDDADYQKVEKIFIDMFRPPFCA